MGTGLTLKGLGQEMHEGGCQKRARSHAQHVLGVAGQHTKTEQGSHPDAPNACRQSAQDNSHQNHSNKRFLFRGWSLFLYIFLNSWCLGPATNGVPILATGSNAFRRNMPWSAPGLTATPPTASLFTGENPVGGSSRFDKAASHTQVPDCA
jgi:hypothetical protein